MEPPAEKEGCGAKPEAKEDKPPEPQRGEGSLDGALAAAQGCSSDEGELGVWPSLTGDAPEKNPPMERFPPFS